MSDQNIEARLEQLVSEKQYNAVRELLINMNIVDIGYFINALPAEEDNAVFRTLPKNLAADVFAELDNETQIRLATTITDGEISALLESLAVDDTVDMLEEMPAELVNKVLKNATPERRALLNQYLNYPEYSAGSIMTAEYSDLRCQMTAKDALLYIRTYGENKESIYTCYVVGARNLLLGVVAIRDLITANDDDLVESLMRTQVVSVKTTDDQERALQLLRKYSLISLPVVDEDNCMVGIVTIDDAVDILQEEATEDFEKMAGISPSDKPYLKTGVVALAKNRLLWLLVLMVSGFISEMILGRYEEAISVVPILVAFIPLLTDMGGDAGSQVSTLIIRGMALGEITMGKTLSILLKEMLVSMMVSLPLAVVNYLRIITFYPDQQIAAIAISLTLICTITMANVLGVLLPVAAKFLKADPALMATPMITTLVDILSMLVYFGLAATMLGL